MIPLIKESPVRSELTFEIENSSLNISPSSVCNSMLTFCPIFWEEISWVATNPKWLRCVAPSLAKALIKAQERKQELKELNFKSKFLKQEKLKSDAAEYDKLKKKKELDDTIKKIEVPTPEKKKKIKKIIYESDTDEESVEEVVVKRKHKPKPKEKNEPSYEQLANMSVEQQIKNKLQQEKITCFFNQLTGKKY